MLRFSVRDGHWNEVLVKFMLRCSVRDGHWNEVVVKFMPIVRLFCF
jgi:hypothetical protein